MTIDRQAGPPSSGPKGSELLPSDVVPFPDDALERSITDRFFAVAAEHADDLALSSPAGSWTYAELAEAIRHRAGAILGVVGNGPARPVALVAAHDGPLVVSIMAVIAAGQLVVVLDPTAPADVTDHVLAEARPALVLHDEEFAAVAEAIAARHPGLTVTDLAALDASPSVGELPPRSPSDAVMLAFTSGTSGASKAAVINHAVILNLVRGATNALGITASDRMPMLFPTSLAVASYPMFIPLLNGGTLATLDVRSVGLAPIGDFFVEQRITLAYMAPTVVRFMVDAVAGYEFPDLRMLALGGELVDGEVVKLTTDLFAPNLLANGFGTTETGVIALHVIDPRVIPTDAVPAGPPVPGVEFLVLDDAGRSVAAGEAGEIVVVSPYMFDGYWGHDDLNAQVLSADPSGRPGWRSYRTGDLGRLDDDGALVVLGRVDTKVKVHGRFVVLGDVESSLHELDAVGDAAVVAVSNADVVELFAFVVPAASSESDPASLRAAMLDRHEAYRVPQRWVVLDELPRLPNGKLDRRALLDQGQHLVVTSRIDALDSPSAGAGTGTSTDERTLRELWELLLPVGLVGVHDDFFDLGGDSLRAAQMLVLLEQRTGVTVPMGEMVNARTISQLAGSMAAVRAAAGHEMVACVQAGDESARPRLWFVHDLQGSAFRIRHLARALGPDQPVWSFESPLLAGEANRFSSLDTFAAAYARALVVAQPTGPIWLGGYSFGGICAVEMARQLRRDGREVVFLGVVDVGPAYRGPNWNEHRVPFRPWFGVEKPPPAGTSLPGRVRHYRDMLRRSRVGTARHLMVRSGAYRLVDPLRVRLDLRRHGRVRPEWRLWHAWHEHWRLGVKSWDRTRPYDGPFDLFWASETGSTDNSLGWGDHVPDLRIHRFDGFHDDLLEERGAPGLGRSLRSVLDGRLAASEVSQPAANDGDGTHAR